MRYSPITCSSGLPTVCYVFSLGGSLAVTICRGEADTEQIPAQADVRTDALSPVSVRPRTQIPASVSRGSTPSARGDGRRARSLLTSRPRSPNEECCSIRRRCVARCLRAVRNVHEQYRHGADHSPTASRSRACTPPSIIRRWAAWMASLPSTLGAPGGSKRARSS